eukprot:scaffold7603_cov834-Prasinococcus_capsulatus_cf.AAC.1
MLDAIMQTIESEAVGEPALPPPTSQGAAAEGSGFSQPKRLPQPDVTGDAARGAMSESEAERFEELRGNHEGMVLYSEGRTAT